LSSLAFFAAAVTAFCAVSASMLCLTMVIGLPPPSYCGASDARTTLRHC
jgi:hypothetical protein